MKLKILLKSLSNKLIKLTIVFIFMMSVGVAGILVGRNHFSKPPTIIYNQSPSEKAIVSRVIDGDTIELADGRVIRYIGIDTPETMHPEKGVECFGPEATERNRELVEGKEIELVGELEDQDQFGRYLRYVYAEGVFVNAELISEGYAYSSSYGSDHRFRQLFVQLEDYSRLKGKGLWEKCIH